MAHSLKGIVALYRYTVVFIHDVVTALYISVNIIYYSRTYST